MASKENAERRSCIVKFGRLQTMLRGAVDGWDFKAIYPRILFYRFISEHMADYFDRAEHEAGDLEFRYADLSDQEAEQDFKPGTVEDKGFFILPSQLFENVVKNASQNENLNEELANIFQDIEKSAIGFKSEDDIKGLFDNLDTEATSLVELFQKKKNAFLTFLMVSIALTLETLRRMTSMPLGMPMSS